MREETAREGVELAFAREDGFVTAAARNWSGTIERSGD